MLIQDALQAVDDLLLTTTTSSVDLLHATSSHILSAGGKRLRPRLVLHAYQATGGQDLAFVVPLAAAVEIIHTATLVHDDINDHGTLRRGRETVNSRWGGTFALLTGDFMFTKAYEIMVPYTNELNGILARAAIELVEGETLQIQAAKAGQIDPDMYMEIIAKKTGALFVAAVELGAVAAGADDAAREALRAYAYNLGLAFQITDDVLDLIAEPEQIGKNAGIDIAQGRGLGVALGSGNGSATRTPPAVTGDTPPGPFKESLIDGQALDLAIQKGRSKARELAEIAAASLDALPPSPPVNDLRALAELVIQRDH
ncbi:MAG: polyprenyl synthetase family protein [Chloroflexi bacterium]|nr:polyprenyl synthetase family protein [Chloroflexota bacterium]